MPEMTDSKPYNGETLASIAAFERLYREQGRDVSWAHHPPATLTLQFVGEALDLCDDPLIIDVGGGEGSKIFKAVKFAQDVGRNLRVVVLEATELGIKLGRERAEELGLSSRVQFMHTNILDVDPIHLVEAHGLAEGIHEYQCINHIPRRHHEEVAEILAALVRPRGLFLTNAFNKNTTDFYGIDVSRREGGELVGEDNISGMYCYFYTAKELRELYDPYFQEVKLKQVPHPVPEMAAAGRVHWELLMTKR